MSCRSIDIKCADFRVKEKTKELMNDYCGVLCAGSTKTESKNLLLAFGGPKIINQSDYLACWMGATARLLDFDDGHRFAMGHPGVVIFPAALATALNTPGTSCKKFIEAIVRGYEMYCYQGRSINSSAYLIRGFDATAICGAAAAAVVASTIMGLKNKAMANAIALASTLCGGLNQAAIDGSDQKAILAGWGAMLGIKAAEWAKNGITGPEHAYEGRLGYVNAFSPSPHLDILNNPMLRYDIKYVYTKVFACVRRIHTTLDLVREAMQLKKWSENDIAKVDVYGCKFLMDAGGYDPVNRAAAQTSIPYAVALLLHYGEVTEELVKNNIGNTFISKLSHKVEVHLDKELVELAEREDSLWGAARVVITNINDERFEKSEVYPLGEYENPFPKKIVKEKFFNLVNNALPNEQVEILWNFIMNLDKENIISNETFPIFKII